MHLIRKVYLLCHAAQFLMLRSTYTLFPKHICQHNLPRLTFINKGILKTCYTAGEVTLQHLAVLLVRENACASIMASIIARLVECLLCSKLCRHNPMSREGLGTRMERKYRQLSATIRITVLQIQLATTAHIPTDI